MALKDIVLHLDETAQAMTRLPLVTTLARHHNAHLIGLFVVDVVLPTIFASDASSGAVVAQIMEDLRTEALGHAARVKAAFEECLRREGVAGEWRQVEGFAPDQVAMHARYADLLVVGQADPDGGRPSGAVLETALFSAGRPVLVIPHNGTFASIGRRVLVGWNASRESARAIHDALPLIARAGETRVLAVNPRAHQGRHGAEPGADIALHLARHGLKVVVEHSISAEVSDGDSLLNAAADMSADLLVVGAYGHSRFRELVLGGVTRTLLESMTVPVLMSH